MEILGKYNQAKVFAKTIDSETEEQIRRFIDQDFVKDAQIRIMPDTHAGAGCVIGFTADLGDKVIPNIVGVDIGCGMLVIELKDRQIDFKELDKIINQYIPSGRNIHPIKLRDFKELKNLYCYDELKEHHRFERSIGTLGGGNHFIEIDIDEDNRKYLIIHTGSRNLGHQIATYYQNLAIELAKGKDDLEKRKKEITENYKAQGRKKELKRTLKKLNKEYRKKKPAYPRDLCYLTGDYRKKYLHDMKLAQEYARLNRETIAEVILDKMWHQSLHNFKYWHTIHNYIDHKNNMIRKGAISAEKGEKILIPLNMRDGSLICIGKGNPDWNYSAPHGAGRTMSRKEARKRLQMSEYRESMKNIYTTSVNFHTLDEAPMAYKSKDEILDIIEDTVEVIHHLRSIYNYKAKE